jgi:hypothetical protein
MKHATLIRSTTNVDDALKGLASVAEDLRQFANYIELMLNRVESTKTVQK